MGASECDGGGSLTATASGVGVEGLETGGVGPRDVHTACTKAVRRGPPTCSPAMAWGPASLITWRSGTSLRFFPFGGPNLGATGTLEGAVLEDLLRCIGCVADASPAV